MATEFNLPGSSFEELVKIVKGYSHAPDNSSLEDLSKLTGLHPTNISRNNKFLTDLSLISGGNRKSATELGRKLGRALDHNQILDTQKYWKEAVQTNEKVSGLITTVRIKGGMTEKEFSSHALYVSGQSNSQGNKTGSRCILDVLLAANLLQEEGGNLRVNNPTQEQVTPSNAEPEKTIIEPPSPPPPKSPQSADPPPRPPSVLATSTNQNIPQIAINIQLHLPETENSEVYEKLFRALRAHLLNPIE